MKGFREKCQKPPFMGILGQNGQFWKILIRGFSGKLARTNEKKDVQTEVNSKVPQLHRETKNKNF